MPSPHRVTIISLPASLSMLLEAQEPLSIYQPQNKHTHPPQLGDGGGWWDDQAERSTTQNPFPILSRFYTRMPVFTAREKERQREREGKSYFTLSLEIFFTV